MQGCVSVSHGGISDLGILLQRKRKAAISASASFPQGVIPPFRAEAAGGTKPLPSSNPASIAPSATL
jgi:hypothetical protein